MQKATIYLMGICLILLVTMQINCQIFINELKKWEFKISNSSVWYPATIPSTLSLDLIDNNLIPKDSYFRSNFLSYYFYQTKDVTYRTNFTVPKQYLSNSSSNILQFKGLDTHCDVYLNGQKILTSRNMYIENKVFVGFKQSNLLEVRFNSSAMYDIEMQKKFYQEQGFNLPQNFSFTRKPAYQYGWDWGPRILTVGIWKPVYVKAYKSFGNITGVVFKHSGVPLKSDAPISLNITFQLQVFKDDPKNDIKVSVDVYLKNKTIASVIKRADRPLNKQTILFDLTGLTYNYIWWPWDLGQPNVLTITLAVMDSNDTIKHTFVTGIRDIAVNQIYDDQGTSFTVNINGKDIFIRGANYIPPEMSLARVPRSKYQQIIQSAIFAKYNMLRIWGGGQFEDDYFYQLCDRAGIMIWHDLMYACALYPYSYLSESKIDQQIFQNVRRIDTHPSIAIWNGNNQVWIGWQQWGWKNKLNQSQRAFVQDDYNKLFKQVIPQNIQKAGSQNFYWQTSPSSSFSSLQSIKSGDIHYWGVWAMGSPIQDYQKYIGRFNSQYGMQSLPQISSIERFTYPQDRFINTYVLRLHQRHPKGDQYLPMYTHNYAGQTQNLQRYAYYSQVMQAYALEMAIGSLRGNKPSCMGSLYWQLNDVWPGATWSTVDYYGVYKAAHYTVRRMHNPLLVYAIHSENTSNYTIYVSNDVKSSISVFATIYYQYFNGSIIFSESIEKTIPSLSYATLKVLTINPALQNTTMMVLKIKTAIYQDENILFFTKPINRKIINPNLSVKYVTSKQGNYAQIKTINLASYVWIHRVSNSTNLPFHLEQNYFHMLPNSTYRVNIGTINPADIKVTCYQNQRIAEMEKYKEIKKENLQQQ